MFHAQREVGGCDLAESRPKADFRKLALGNAKVLPRRKQLDNLLRLRLRQGDGVERARPIKSELRKAILAGAAQHVNHNSLAILPAQFLHAAHDRLRLGRNVDRLELTATVRALATPGRANSARTTLVRFPISEITQDVVTQAVAREAVPFHGGEHAPPRRAGHLALFRR